MLIYESSHSLPYYESQEVVTDESHKSNSSPACSTILFCFSAFGLGSRALSVCSGWDYSCQEENVNFSFIYFLPIHIKRVRFSSMANW